ncbi:hypothetical protein GCM10010289_72590 [Streptomyces violascens]|nr:hypothetical protein GCM10010289_72590 [Streptomyces violascens]
MLCTVTSRQDPHATTEHRHKDDPALPTAKEAAVRKPRSGESGRARRHRYLHWRNQNGPPPRRPGRSTLATVQRPQ